MNKLADQEYITLLPFEGKRVCVIYLNNYLFTMFEISDVMIDKEEVALSLKIQIEVPDKMPDSEYTITEEQMSVSVAENKQPKITPEIYAVKDASSPFRTGIHLLPMSEFPLYIISIIEQQGKWYKWGIFSLYLSDRIRIRGI